MTDPEQPPTEPVLNAGALAGALSGAVATVGMVLVGTGWLTKGQVDTAAHIVQLVVFAAVTVIAGLSPYLAAWHARKKVTPLTAPRDYDGVALVRDDAPVQPAPPAEPAPAPRGPDTAAFKAQLDHDYEQWRAACFPDHTEEIPAVTDPHGIHAHPSKKLGKRPPIPGRKAVAFGDFLTAAPEHPLIDVAPRLVYPMDCNDVAGDCVVAGLDHTLQTVHALLDVPRQNWSDAELLAYYQTQNPDFRSWSDGGSNADRGMVIQTFLEYLVAQGVILAFGKIDHTNEDEMKAAAYLGLAIVTGEELETAQQTQTVWDYKRSGDWGGHCTCTVGYSDSPDRQTIVTWGELVDVTQSFITHQLDEAWFVLTQAHVDHPAFRVGFDLAGFAAAVSQLTDGKVVVPVPAPQPPAPPAPTPPPPAPGTVAVPAALAAEVTAWSKRALSRKDDSHADKKAAKDWADFEASSSS